ncbi:hypothetical protein G4B88_025907 [Cannabis sativa]|uniref:peroxidase n=1 Tax=Cannabis sativa TaxID=3483 RepID=A0A7J6HH00_CANSA|nr:hypothetical protein G4B88_025907 [Cannabis sativa]
MMMMRIGSGQLSSSFYSSSCPNVLSTIRAEVRSAVSKESRMGASLLRLHFHDCFVNVSSHTIGQARCTTFRARLYNEANIDSSFATSTKANCPNSGGDNTLSPLDVTTPNTFDNAYFKNLVANKGLLHSDQQLFSGGSTNSQVNTYNSNAATFKSDFAAAMVKMGNISPLTGSQGQIRTNCRKVN